MTSLRPPSQFLAAILTGFLIGLAVLLGPSPLALAIGADRPLIAETPQGETQECDPAYPDADVCIPPAPPDLDCGDIEYRDFTVEAPDPHRFDRDKDGIGCESSR